LGGIRFFWSESLSLVSVFRLPTHLQVPYTSLVISLIKNTYEPPQHLYEVLLCRGYFLTTSFPLSGIKYFQPFSGREELLPFDRLSPFLFSFRKR